MLLPRVVQVLHAAILLAALAPVAPAAEAKPNIVVILADDLGREDCGFMGGDEIKTPHLDKLAAAGATLDAHYVQPLCSPTRAALMTGRYPMRQGLQVSVVKPWAKYGLPLEERLLPQALQEAGYATGVFGKWHLGFITRDYLPTSRGFDRQYGHYNGALDCFTHQRDGGHDWHENDQASYDKGYSTKLIAQHAAEFVAEHAGQQPFFLYVPFNAVHSPLQSPKRYTDAYPQLKGQRKQYAGMLTAMDDGVGEIVAAVEKAGVRDDTLFIFSSDNGGPAPGKVTDNGKYRGGKGGLYEGGVRVAAFATWDDRIAAGSTVEEPMHVVDWYPTLLKLAGASAEQSLPIDGVDVWPTLTEGAPSPHDAILLNTTPEVGAVRAGDWKLIVKQKEGRPARKAAQSSIELFNLRSDPYEQTNLVDQHAGKVQELQTSLAGFASQATPPKSQPKPRNFVVPAIWGE